MAGATLSLSLGMAGPSMWSKVKRSKGPLDVKRGAAFSKLVKKIHLGGRIWRRVPLGESLTPSAGSKHLCRGDNPQNVHSNFDIFSNVLAGPPA